MKINLDFIMVIVFIISTLLINPLLGNEVVQYVDELLLIFAILRIIFQFKLLNRQKEKRLLLKKTAFIIISLTILGSFSNIFSKLADFKPAVIDWIGIVKIPIVFVYASCIISQKTKNKICKTLYFIALLFIPIAFGFGVLNLFSNIGMTYDIRYGIRSYEFIYRNPAALNEAILCLLAIVYKEKNKHMYIYSIIAILTVLFTLRGATFGLILVFFYLIIIIKDNRTFKIKFYHIGIAGILALAIGKNQVVYYLLKESPRSIMLGNSFKVALRFFPLGSGFATYGSDQAFKNYSSLYREFGYNSIYWLSQKGGYAANDNFWPMIIGQFGFLGIIIYGMLIKIQFDYVLKNQVNKEIKVIQIVLYVLIIISSLGNAIFTSVSGMMVIIFISLLMTNNEFE